MGMAIDSLPNDVEVLRAFALQVVAERNGLIVKCEAAIAERDAAVAENARKEEINAQLRQLLRQAMGIDPKSERLARLDPDQLRLALEDLEQASARGEAEEDKREPARAAAVRGAIAAICRPTCRACIRPSSPRARFAPAARAQCM